MDRCFLENTVPASQQTPPCVHVGLDIGSTTTKVAVLDPQTEELLFWDYRRHGARQAQSVIDILALVAERFPASELRLAVCGSGARGIAANQIGVSKQMFAILDERDNVQVMCNPKIVFGLNAFKAEEGCLSRDTYTKVTRYSKIKLQYQILQDGALRTRKRDFQGWTAQVIQHMIDHCKGKLV